MLELDAAIRLREAGYRQTVLLLEGFFSMEELAWIEQYHLSTVIHNREQLAMLSAYRPHGRIGLNIFLKINTGMNRLGFTLEQFPAALEAIRAIHAVRRDYAYDSFRPCRRMQRKGSYYRAIATLQSVCRRPPFILLAGQFCRYPALS